MNKSGIILIDKCVGWTSNDVVKKIKNITKAKKVGHLGTLDPIASGVLPITLNYATKLFEIFLKKNKEYIAKFEFGYETDTLDSTGVMTNQSDNIPDENQIIAVMQKFVGEYNQIPPQFSAKKVNGKPAYFYARNGKTVELNAKKIKIFDFEFIEYKNNVLKCIINCSSGTYIRSLCRDLAYELNSYATMIELERTKCGNFEINQCQKIEDITKENFEKSILNIEDILDFPKIIINENEFSKLKNGMEIEKKLVDGKYLLIYENSVLGIGLAVNQKLKNSVYLYDK